MHRHHVSPVLINRNIYIEIATFRDGNNFDYNANRAGLLSKSRHLYRVAGQTAHHRRSRVLRCGRVFTPHPLAYITETRQVGGALDEPG